MSIDEIDALDVRKTQTDFDHLKRITDEELESAIADDPDADPGIDWSSAELVQIQSKTPISIRLDADVLAFFKAEGAGYQKRINAVLRSYMDHAQRKKAARLRGHAARNKADRLGRQSLTTPARSARQAPSGWP